MWGYFHACALGRRRRRDEKKIFQNHEHENENAETMMGWKTRKITTCINLAYPRRFVDKTHCCPDKIFQLVHMEKIAILWSMIYKSCKYNIHNSKNIEIFIFSWICFFYSIDLETNSLFEMFWYKIILNMLSL